jgi:hypothetical protein
MLNERQLADLGKTGGHGDLRAADITVVPYRGHEIRSVLPMTDRYIVTAGDDTELWRGPLAECRAAIDDVMDDCEVES